MPLTINGKVFEKLSGPVSFALLVPKRNVNLPTVMLLGEEHGPVKRLCGGDTNPKEIIDDFIQQINTLAGTFNIHFYAEQFLEETILNTIKNSSIEELNAKLLKHDKITNDKILKSLGIKIRDEGLLSYIYGFNKLCYYNELKKKSIESFHHNCRYPNIKWQFSDARHTSGKAYTIENIMEIDVYITNTMNELFNYTPEYYECWAKKFKNVVDHDPKNHFSSYPFKQEEITRLQKKYVFRGIEDDEALQNEMAMEMLTLLYDFHANSSRNFVDKLLEQQIFSKQIEKSHFTPETINFIKRNMIKYFENIKQTSCRVPEFKESTFIEFLREWLTYLHDKTNQEQFVILIEIIKRFKTESEIPCIADIKLHPCYLTAPFSAILDIYLALRVFKQNAAEKIDLVCALIGGAHIKHLVGFMLQNYNELYDVYQCNSDDPYAEMLGYTQCIDFSTALHNNANIKPFNMDLNKIIANVVSSPVYYTESEESSASPLQVGKYEESPVSPLQVYESEIANVGGTKKKRSNRKIKRITKKKRNNKRSAKKKKC